MRYHRIVLDPKARMVRIGILHITLVLLFTSQITLAFLVGNGVPSTVSDSRPVLEDSATAVPERWFRQKLDHFNPADNQYWQQRYYINDTFYKPGGAAFLYIGPEVPLTEDYARTGGWLEYAKVYSAIGFALEHRYYGKSHPTADLSTDNLKYLTVEQALEDLATFISAANTNHNLTNAKWVVFGGSYGGLLSAWMRYKFPHLVDGAVADSAPLLVPMTAPGYIITAGEILRTVPGCYEAVSAASDDIKYHLKSDSGTTRLRKLFRLCDFDRSNKLDVASVTLTMFGSLITAIQFNDVYNVPFPTGIERPSVASMCRVMTDKSRGLPLERLADYAAMAAMNYTALNGSCLNFAFNAVLAKGKKLRFEDNIDVTGRQWKYQSCTQIGVFATTEGDNQPFGDAVTEDYYFKLCEGMFGSKFNKSLLTRGHDEILMNYGGKDIPATNIVYTQGSSDPWYKYGFTKDTVPRTHVIMINGVGHVPDLFSSSPLESAEMKQARVKIQKYIGEFITDVNHVPIIG